MKTQLQTSIPSNTWWRKRRWSSKRSTFFHYRCTKQSVVCHDCSMCAAIRIVLRSVATLRSKRASPEALQIADLYFIWCFIHNLDIQQRLWLSPHVAGRSAAWVSAEIASGQRKRHCRNHLDDTSWKKWSYVSSAARPAVEFIEWPGWNGFEFQHCVVRSIASDPRENVLCLLIYVMCVTKVIRNTDTIYRK